MSRAHLRPAAVDGAIARSTLTVLAGSAVGLLGALAIRVLLARLLAPAEVGALVLGMAISAAVAGVATLGLGQALARRVAELRAAARASAARASGSNGMLLGVVSGFVAALAVVLAAPFAERIFGAAHLGSILRLMAPVVVALPIGAAAVGVGRAWGDATGRALVREAGGGLLRVAGVALGAALFHDLRAVAAGFAVGALLGEVLYACFVWAKGWFARPENSLWDSELIRRLPPFWSMMAIVQVETWLGVLVLGLFAPPGVVAIYGLARGVTRAVKLVEYAASHSFMPTATALLQRGSAGAFLRLYVRARTLIFALQWPALAVGIFAPTFVMTTLFGPAYGEGGKTLCLLAVAGAVTSLVSVGKDQTLVATGRARDVVAIDCVSVGLTAVALMVLTPSYGSVGAAVAALVGAAAQAVALTWFVVVRSGVVPIVRDVHPLPLIALAGCGVAALLAAVAGAPPLVGFLIVATCGCLGSAVCLVALWLDHGAAGSIFPGAARPGKVEDEAQLLAGEAHGGDTDPAPFEP